MVSGPMWTLLCPTSCEQSHYAGSLRSGGDAEQEAGTKQTGSDGAQQGRSTGLTGPNWTMKQIANSLQVLERMAGTTGLEPATSAVTGQRSNQLNYVPTLFSPGCWETLDFPVFSYCPQRRLRQPFPPHITEFRGLMDRKWTGSQRPNPVARPYDPAHLSMHRG
jgi:hypothetical protein